MEVVQEALEAREPPRFVACRQSGSFLREGAQHLAHYNVN